MEAGLSVRNGTDEPLAAAVMQICNLRSMQQDSAAMHLEPCKHSRRPTILRSVADPPLDGALVRRVHHPLVGGQVLQHGQHDQSATSALWCQCGHRIGSNGHRSSKRLAHQGCFRLQARHVAAVP